MTNKIINKRNVQNSKDPQSKNNKKVKLQPLPPILSIIEEEPPMITRPLCLINGKAYATVWRKVEEKSDHGKDDNGNIIPLEKPEIKINERILVIREDGQIFGLKKPIDDLGFEIHLVEKPVPSKTWSAKGVNKYIAGYRPTPKDVCDRIIQVIDHFIDFNRSLSDQRTMCELIACWIIATWFLDAFNVTGYLWITGEKGSGKSDLLQLVAELSYLGQFISNSGSFASLRDMSDYGATLAFDDAEGITRINEKDQDKRSLLLAGNHRGAHVTLKVQGPDKSWHTKFVNAFCPKAFSAIKVPDSVLISRSLTVPMVRTADIRRGNIDPADYKEWPCDRQTLIEDLWAMPLYYLSKMPEIDNWVGSNAEISGRNLQPWRNVLAVAKWLDEKGVSNLYQRMHSLALDYQKKRLELELGDMTRLVLQSLCQCAISAIKANSAINKKKNGHFEIKVSEVVVVAKTNVEEDEWDIDKEKITNRWVGRVMGKLRFDQAPRPGGKGSRLWKIELEFLVQLAKSYNVYLPEELAIILAIKSAPHGENGTDGTNGSDGTETINLNERSDNYDPRIKPDKPCPSCKENDYRQRPDGGWVCNICHPSC